MTSQRASGHTIPPTARPAVSAAIPALPDVWINNFTDHAQVGFTADQARKAHVSAARSLFERVVAPGSVGREIVHAARRPFNQASLRLDDSTKFEVLRELRALGAGLRAHSDALAARLFPSADTAPALEFIENDNPIPWEFFYEGDMRGLPQWERFWGFRAPISHWRVKRNAAENFVIPVRNGVFSAVCETLCGTGPEVRELLEQFPGLTHGCLAQEFRDRVVRECPRHPTEDRDWLRWFLLGKPDYERSVWKSDALIEILGSVRGHHPIIHFACHCVRGESSSELLSHLSMQIGGESLELTAAQIETDLRIEQAQRGGLVFLNACGTGRPSDEPPAFPLAWISFGAAAVIATLCSVPDDFALAFGVRFYEALEECDGDVADALLLTRRYFMTEYNNPLGLAYVLYARKGTRVGRA